MKTFGANDCLPRMDSTPPSDEAASLRRTVRDLVALSSLPSIWVDCKIERSLQNLTDVLRATLRAQTVCLRVELPDGSRFETSASEGLSNDAPHTFHARELLDAVPADSQELVSLPRFNGTGPINALPHAVFAAGKQVGHLVACFREDVFPRENERLILQVAANQITLLLQRHKAQEESFAELKRTEQELRRKTNQLGAFLETAAVGLHRVGPDGTILWANDAEMKMLGYSPEEYIGHHIAEFHADEPVINDILRRLTCGEKLCEREARLKCKDGSVKTVLIDSSVFREDGKFIHTQCFTRDITEKKRADQMLREMNERLTKVLEVETVGVMFWDLTTGCLIDANDTFLRMMGYSRAEVESRSLTWEKFTPPEFYEISRGEIEKFMTTGRVGPYEKEYFHKDGTRQWLLFAGSSLGSNQCVEFCVDISGRKEIERALRESEERFRAVVNNSNAIIWVKDTDGRYFLINHEFEKRFGVTEQQFVGKTDFDFFPAEIAQTFRDNDLKIIRSGQPLEVEEAAPHDDALHSFLSVKFPLRRTDGTIYAVAGIATDITERKRVEESAARLAAIVEHSDDAIFSTDLDGTITSWNRGAERLYGYTEAEAIGHSLTMLIPVGRANEEPAMLQRICRGESVENYETERRRKDGRVIDVSLTVSPVKDAKGKIIGASKVCRDITDKIRAKEKLEQTVTERTASLREAIEQMEEFSYTVSHDLRAPLRAMTAYAGVLLEDYGSQMDETARSYLEKIQRSSDRMNRLTQDVLTYAQVARSVAQPEQIDLNRLVQDVIHQHTNLQQPAAEIEIVGPLPTVMGHETMLGQSFSNLLNNAVKFVAPGVKPHVRIRAERSGKNVRVWFEDNGIGIKPADQERIFNMFERVHPADKYDGTGIGLTIVRKAVDKMGGRAGVESDGQSGTRFWIELRIAE